jgi:hypothetical protein
LDTYFIPLTQKAENWLDNNVETGNEWEWTHVSPATGFGDEWGIPIQKSGAKLFLEKMLRADLEYGVDFVTQPPIVSKTTYSASLLKAIKKLKEGHRQDPKGNPMIIAYSNPYRPLRYVAGNKIAWDRTQTQWGRYFRSHPNTNTRMSFQILLATRSDVNYDKEMGRKGREYRTRGLVSSKGLEGFIRFSTHGTYWVVNELTVAPWNTRHQKGRLRYVGTKLLLGVMAEAMQYPKFKELLLTPARQARSFYKHYGFRQSATGMLHIWREDIAKILAQYSERKIKGILGET